MKNIYPSLIAADILNLEKEIKNLQVSPYCAGFHIDVMDNHFVPNLTWGQMFVNAISKVTNRPTWVHLMIDNPSIFVESLDLKEKSIVTFHIETVGDVEKFSILLRNKNLIPSIALSPKTPVEKIFPFIDFVDHFLIMTVEPGFSGQDFLKNSISKIETLFSYCDEYYKDKDYKKIGGYKKMDYKKNERQIRIGVDGGVGEENIFELSKMGVDDFAIGSGIFGFEDRIAQIKKLYELI